MLFALYGTFIEDFKEKNPGEQDKMSMSLSAKQENTRFVKIVLKVNNTDIDASKFESIIKLSAAEKGKIRKFVGLNLIKEFREENKDWFKYSSNNSGATVELLIPLHQ